MTQQEKQPTKHNYSKVQRTILVVCTIIILGYTILTYLITQGSFWNFAGFHVMVAVLTIPFIWLRNMPKIITYFVTTLSVIGAGTALGLVLFYLVILSNLANS